MYHNQSYSKRLADQIAEKSSVLCLGLDPHLNLFPECYINNDNPLKGIEELLIDTVEAAGESAAVLKPQLAFYEAFGPDGVALLWRLAHQWQEQGHIVIADAKRGDIGSTAQAYAEAFIGKHAPFDAITVNPYMGIDSIEPFATVGAENGTGLYVLCKTSNPAAAEIQDLVVGDSLLYEEVARMTARIGSQYLDQSSGLSHVGAVVGATHPEDLRHLRSEMAAQPFLIPGYGAQGGSAQDIVGGFKGNPHAAVVNSSRGIMFCSDARTASTREEFRAAVQTAAQSARSELWQAANQQ